MRDSTAGPSPLAAHLPRPLTSGGMKTTARHPAFRRITAALLLAALPTLASAQSASMPGASMSFSKSDMILGTTSAMDRLLARQDAPIAPRAAFIPTTFTAGPATQLLVAAIANTLVPAIVSTPISADRPDVFKSVALPI